MSSDNAPRWPQLLIAFALVAMFAALATAAATEILMDNTPSERNMLLLLLGSIAVASVAVLLIFLLFTPRSLIGRMLLAAISGPIVIATALITGTQTMLVDSDQLRFLLIVLSFASVLGVGVTFALARPLRSDLKAITGVAVRVGQGDLEARADLDRLDEVGELSGAIDSMVEQISTSRSQRDEAERERSVTLASLSHDARTPLTSMRLATEALIDGVAPDPQRYLRAISTDISAVETLINDLFLIGQIEAGRLRLRSGPMDAMTTVGDVATQLRPIAEDKGVELHVHGPANFPVTADPTQLNRVLSNVISNAIRHAPVGDEIQIDVDGQQSRISVRDGGDGFPADFVEEAFQPFRRHDEARERSQGGAGLGLAVSRGIVDALGGAIWADPGPGGVVHIELPA